MLRLSVSAFSPGATHRYWNRFTEGRTLTFVCTASFNMVRTIPLVEFSVITSLLPLTPEAIYLGYTATLGVDFGFYLLLWNRSGINGPLWPRRYHFSYLLPAAPRAARIND